MTSKTLGEKLIDLGIKKTHSRPRVSNDNPFSEAQFRTLKYWPGFPSRFESPEHARQMSRSFFPMVQPRASSLRAVLLDCPRWSTTARPNGSSPSDIAFERLPTSNDPSASSMARPGSKSFPRRSGSIRPRKRRTRLPQDQRTEEKTTLRSSRFSRLTRPSPGPGRSPRRASAAWRLSKCGRPLSQSR